MSPYQPTVVESYGRWELIEGLSGRALRRRRPRVGPAKPHLLMGTAAIALGAWMNLTGKLADRPAAAVLAFGALVVIWGTRFSARTGKELRFGASELTWATPGEAAGTRWPHTDLSHIEIFEPLKNLPPGMARRTKPRFRVSIRTKEGGELPLVCVLLQQGAAIELAQCLSEATGLDVKTGAGKSAQPASPPR